jgi:alanyl-tRNA synthetase
MTEKLYYNEPYLKEWEAEVLQVSEREEKIMLLLDKTAFYPEGGGQPCDKGFIGEAEVLYVFEEEKNIYHVVDKKPENSQVRCKLNFERRFDLMQQHTGQHLLSSVFFDKYKGETSSFHIGEDYVSIDISITDMNEEIIKNVETIVNDFIYSNLEIKTYMVTMEGLGRLPLRKLPKVDEDIRIVEIDKIDYSPCCGTHLTTLGELGVLKIVKTEKYKGATRVYFKCGRRAFEDFRIKQDIVSNLCKILSVDLESLQDKIKVSAEEVKNNQKEIKELKDKLHAYEARDIIKTSDSDFIFMNFKDRNFEEVQSIGRAVLQSGEFVVVLSSHLDKKLWFAHNGSVDIHCGRIFKESLQRFNGRGGGGDKQAQAAFTNEEDLINFENFLKEKYNEI